MTITKNVYVANQIMKKREESYGWDAVFQIIGDTIAVILTSKKRQMWLQGPDQ